MSEGHIDFSKFGKSFQENLCHLILVDRSFADQIFEVLDINFLELRYLQVFIRRILNYRERYSVHPSTSIMKSVLRTELESEPESIKIRLRDYYAGVLASGEINDSDYIKRTSLDFSKKQMTNG